MRVGTLTVGGALGAMRRYWYKVRVITSEPTINSEPLRQLLDFIDCFRMTSRAYVSRVRNNTDRIEVRAGRPLRGKHIAVLRNRPEPMR
jgi:hypothetical protein